jgi:orotidine 5'-phosphate decarboxylase subfamily 2
MTSFFERIIKRSTEIQSLLCVGLDPHGEQHSVSEIASFNRELIEATKSFAVAYKPNFAFYESYGIPGLIALEETLKAIPKNIPVIADAKRGDIGSTAEAYAKALFDEWAFDAVTVNPYMGKDSVEPFLQYSDRGIFILCRTSNPGAQQFQSLTLNDGQFLYEYLAKMVITWGSNVGLVIGATAPEELQRIHRLVPNTPLLVPGIGAQGGSINDVIQAAYNGWGKMLINVSRGIAYAGIHPDDSAKEAERICTLVKRSIKSLEPRV